MGELIKEHYGPVLALGATATQQQMLDQFTKLWPRATGDTRRKAVGFFLKACEYGGITVSKFWKVPASGGRSRGGRTERPSTPAVESPSSTPPAPSDGKGKTITLRSGGSITLTVDVDLFALSESDRAFALELIDKLRKYEEPKGALPPGEGEDALRGNEE